MTAHPVERDRDDEIRDFLRGFPQGDGGPGWLSTTKEDVEMWRAEERAARRKEAS